MCTPIRDEWRAFVLRPNSSWPDDLYGFDLISLITDLTHVSIHTRLNRQAQMAHSVRHESGGYPICGWRVYWLLIGCECRDVMRTCLTSQRSASGQFGWTPCFLEIKVYLKTGESI